MQFLLFVMPLRDCKFSFFLGAWNMFLYWLVLKGCFMRPANGPDSSLTFKQTKQNIPKISMAKKRKML